MYKRQVDAIRLIKAGVKEKLSGRAVQKLLIRKGLGGKAVSYTHLDVYKRQGLSLSDQYWIRPAKSGIGWSQINFFEHPFSEDMGNILFGKKASGEEPSLMSPDNTSDGWLKKKWKIAGGKRCLIKGGSGATRQEPYNEVIASRIMKRLSIPCASYSLLIEEEEPYSCLLYTSRCV